MSTIIFIVTPSPTLPFPSRSHYLSTAFAPLAVPGANLILAKAVYVGINLIGCGLLLWKVKSLGLLPVTSADWVHLLPPKTFSDFSSAFF